MPIDLATFGLSVITAGGGAAVIAYGVFRTVGAKWMDNRFARQLETSRQAHATETEHLRFRIAGMLDRATKLNQREFEILPDIWAKADDAHYATLNLISRWREYPDFSRMGEAQFEEALQNSTLSEWQRGEMRSKDRFQRTTYYSEAMKWEELNQARKASYAFSTAVSKGGIYLHPDTFAFIDKFAGMIVRTVQAWKLDVQFRADGGSGKVDNPNDPIELYRNQGQQQFDALGKFLRSRYWDVSLELNGALQ